MKFLLNLFFFLFLLSRFVTDCFYLKDRFLSLDYTANVKKRSNSDQEVYQQGYIIKENQVKDYHNLNILASMNQKTESTDVRFRKIKKENSEDNLSFTTSEPISNQINIKVTSTISNKKDKLRSIYNSMNEASHETSTMLNTTPVKSAYNQRKMWGFIPYINQNKTTAFIDNKSMITDTKTRGTSAEETPNIDLNTKTDSSNKFVYDLNSEIGLQTVGKSNKNRSAIKMISDLYEETKTPKLNKVNNRTKNRLITQTEPNLTNLGANSVYEDIRVKNITEFAAPKNCFAFGSTENHFDAAIFPANTVDGVTTVKLTVEKLSLQNSNGSSEVNLLPGLKKVKNAFDNFEVEKEIRKGSKLGKTQVDDVEIAGVTSPKEIDKIKRKPFEIDELALLGDDKEMLPTGKLINQSPEPKILSGENEATNTVTFLKKGNGKTINESIRSDILLTPQQQRKASNFTTENSLKYESAEMQKTPAVQEPNGAPIYYTERNEVTQKDLPQKKIAKESSETNETTEHCVESKRLSPVRKTNIMASHSEEIKELALKEIGKNNCSNADELPVFNTHQPKAVAYFCEKGRVPPANKNTKNSRTSEKENFSGNDANNKTIYSSENKEVTLPNESKTLLNKSFDTSVSIPSQEVERKRVNLPIARKTLRTKKSGKPENEYAEKEDNSTMGYRSPKTEELVPLKEHEREIVHFNEKEVVLPTKKSKKHANQTPETKTSDLANYCCITKKVSATKGFSKQENETSKTDELLHPKRNTEITSDFHETDKQQDGTNVRGKFLSKFSGTLGRSLLDEMKEITDLYSAIDKLSLLKKEKTKNKYSEKAKLSRQRGITPSTKYSKTSTSSLQEETGKRGSINSETYKRSGIREKNLQNKQSKSYKISLLEEMRKHVDNSSRKDVGYFELKEKDSRKKNQSLFKEENPSTKYSRNYSISLLTEIRKTTGLHSAMAKKPQLKDEKFGKNHSETIYQSPQNKRNRVLLLNVLRKNENERFEINSRSLRKEWRKAKAPSTESEQLQTNEQLSKTENISSDAYKRPVRKEKRKTPNKHSETYSVLLIKQIRKYGNKHSETDKLSYLKEITEGKSKYFHRDQGNGKLDNEYSDTDRASISKGRGRIKNENWGIGEPTVLGESERVWHEYSDDYPLNDDSSLLNENVASKDGYFGEEELSSNENGHIPFSKANTMEYGPQEFMPLSAYHTPFATENPLQTEPQGSQLFVDTTTKNANLSRPPEPLYTENTDYVKGINSSVPDYDAKIITRKNLQERPHKRKKEIDHTSSIAVGSTTENKLADIGNMILNFMNPNLRYESIS